MIFSWNTILLTEGGGSFDDDFIIVKIKQADAINIPSRKSSISYK